MTNTLLNRAVGERRCMNRPGVWRVAVGSRRCARQVDGPLGAELVCLALQRIIGCAQGRASSRIVRETAVLPSHSPALALGRIRPSLSSHPAQPSALQTAQLRESTVPPSRVESPRAAVPAPSGEVDVSRTVGGLVVPRIAAHHHDSCPSRRRPRR
ncbi:hypothetical protein P154DRAFT_49386 [Amniculicola lignicola CBS 123094]|uniref:Uncharacterized protein n=1 Tax=Amniculicola lignicola CBS 123094 TaxID=1392246 RepID=A0A6A5VYB9_9PLEO|nr:hypothetical protein P154DRAFT_49386 [Amniculicola lignicola CBS 123094]